MCANTRRIRGSSHLVGAAVVLLGVPGGPAAAQDVALASLPASPRQEVPRDVRIMQTIVATALSEVEPPETPPDLATDSAAHGVDVEGVAPLGFRWSTGSATVGGHAFGRGDVSGFYMEDYGYLFTVRWPVSSLRAAATAELMRQAIERQRAVRVGDPPDEEASSAVFDAWTERYRSRLSDALRDAIAAYGSTLRRARPGESITFIADFGGGDDEVVTMTVEAQALQGSDLDANRGAIRISRGRSGMSERMDTQLRIMSRIIDTSLRSDDPDRYSYVRALGSLVGGQAEAQYVPGYGVIFRKQARLSTARTFSAGVSRTSRPGSPPDSAAVAARRLYERHLDTLRWRTAEILAEYGPTLTELGDGDWVGIHYDVGSAAALLDGGIDDYLVQAPMREIRQAATQNDPVAWLRERLVTNERQD